MSEDGWVIGALVGLAAGAIAGWHHEAISIGVGAAGLVFIMVAKRIWG